MSRNSRSSRSSKKNILISYGISNNLVGTDKRKHSGRGHKVASGISSLLERFSNKYDGFIAVDMSIDSRALFANSPKLKKAAMRCLNVELSSEVTLSTRNKMTIPTVDGEDHYLDSTWIRDLFPPNEYNIFIVGIDINNIIAPSIKQFIELGYKVTTVGGLLLPFSREASENIRSSGAYYMRFRVDSDD